MLVFLSRSKCFWLAFRMQIIALTRNAPLAFGVHFQIIFNWSDWHVGVVGRDWWCLKNSIIVLTAMKKLKINATTNMSRSDKPTWACHPEWEIWPDSVCKTQKELGRSAYTVHMTRPYERREDKTVKRWLTTLHNRRPFELRNTETALFMRTSKNIYSCEILRIDNIVIYGNNKNR